MTTKDYDKKPPLPAGLQLEGERELPAVPSGLILHSVKKKESGNSPLPSSGEDLPKDSEPFPLTYKRDKEQMVADIRTPQQKAQAKGATPLAAGFVQVQSPKKDETFKVEITDKEAEQKAFDSFKNGEHSVEQNSQDPVGELASQINIKKYSYPDYKVARKKIEILNDNFFQTGEEAERYLQQNQDKPETNVTKQLATKRYKEYENVKTSLHGSNSLEEAAIKYAANSGDEQVKALLEASGGSLGGFTDATSSVPMVVRGQKLLSFMMNKDVRQMAEKDPQLKQSLKEEMYNFPNHHPEYAEKLLAEAIANRRDAKGENNSFANIVSKSNTDKIVDELIADGTLPNNYKFLYEKPGGIRSRLGTARSIGRGIGNAIPGINQLVNEGPIPTPGLLENFESGLETHQVGIAKSIANFNSLFGFPTVTDMIQPEAQQVFNVIKKQAETPQFEPSSLRQKFTMHGGNMAAFVTMLSGGSAALKATNLIKSPALANAAMMVLATHGENDDRAKALFPRNDFKQHVYIDTMGILNAALGKYLPGQNIGRLLSKGEGTIADILGKMVDGKVSTSAAKNQIMDWFGNTAKSTIGGAEFMGAISAADDLLTQTLQGKGLKLDQTLEAGWEGAKMGLIATPLLGGFEAALKSNKGFRTQVLEMAENSEYYKKLAETEAEKDPEFRKIKDDVIKNLDYIGNVYKEFEGTDMSIKDKQKSLLNSLAHKIKLNKAELATDPTIKKNFQQDAKDLSEVISGTLNGIPEEKVKLNQAIRDVKELYTEDFLSKGAKEMLESKKTEEGEAKFDEGKVKKFLEFVAQQSNNIIEDGKFDTKTDVRKSVKYPKQLIELANEMFPEYGKTAEESDAAKESSPTPMQDQKGGAAESVVPSTLKEGKRGYLSKDDGSDFIFYHGSKSGDISEFNTEGVFLTQSLPYAKTYAGDGGVVYEVRVKNGKIKEHDLTKGDKYIQHTKKQGDEDILIQYDNTAKGERQVFEAIVYDPKKVEIIKKVDAKQQSSPTEQVVNEPKEETPKFSEQTEATSSEPSEPNKAGSEAEGDEAGRLAHADTEQIYKEQGLPERLQTPTKHNVDLEKEADELIKKGYDFDKKADEVMKGDGKFEDVDQVAFAKQVASLKVKQEKVDINSPEFDKLQGQIEKLSRAADVAGTLGGRFLQSRKVYVPKDESISDYVMREKEAAQVETLTEEQKKTAKREFEDISEAKKKFDEYMIQKEAEFAAKQAQAAFEADKKTTKKTPKKDFKTERDKIFSSIKDKLKAARGDTSATIVPYAKELFAIAPDVAKLVKSYVEQGVIEFAEIVKKVHGDLKDEIKGITDKDIVDLMAGVYNEKKQPRSELTRKMFELRQQSQLINKLDKLLNGEQPITEKAKIQRNKEIAELKKQIKNISEFENDVEKQKSAKSELAAKEKSTTEKDLNKAEKEINTAEEKERKRLQREAEVERKKLEREFEKEKRDEERAALKLKVDEAKKLEKELSYRTPEERALGRIKSKMEKDIKLLEYKLKTGDFDSEVPNKKPISLDEEGKKLKDKLLRLKAERGARLMKLDVENKNWYQRNVGRPISHTLNSLRVLKSSFDVSMPFRQGLWAVARQGLSSPIVIEGGKVKFTNFAAQKKLLGEFRRMYAAMGSEKVSRRIMDEITSSSRFEIAEKSGLNLANPESLENKAREDSYGVSYIERVPVLGESVPIGKEGKRIGGLVKASERAATTFVNSTKWNIFNEFVDSFIKQGKTIENSPKDYEAAATYANQAVGRGKLKINDKYDLEKSNSFTSRIFFSLRLQASRLQLLTNFANPFFYAKAPREVRIAYLKDAVKFVALGMSVLAMANQMGLSVGINPYASNFGKIRVGDTEYDIWGGFSQWATFLFRAAAGKSTDKGGYTEDVNRIEVIGRFARSKESPELGIAHNLAGGEDYLGQPTDVKKEAINAVLPLIGKDVTQAYQDGGVQKAFVTWLLASHGVGVQTYDHTPTASTGSYEKPSKPTKKEKDKPTKR